MRSVKALIVPVGEAGRVEEVHVDLAHLQQLVGGYIEAVSAMLSSTWHAYCDEEGKLKGLPVNRLATALARELGWAASADDDLCGLVVFFGNTSDGEEADVPDVVLAAHDHLLRQAGDA